MKGVKVPYERQGLIYFTCRNFATQPVTVREKILRLVENHGGEYADALFDHLTQGTSVVALSQIWYVDAKVIYTIRKRFYEAW